MPNRYISDLHLFQDSALYFDNRDFKSGEDMRAFILDSWNSTVDAGDDVYILGDVSLKPTLEVASYVSNLKGKLHLIIGNHDTVGEVQEFDNLFMEKVHYKEIYDDGILVVMSHYPFWNWNNMRRGAVHIYGHTHSTNMTCRFNAYNAWCVGCGYAPQLLDFFKKRDGYLPDGNVTFSASLSSMKVEL